MSAAKLTSAESKEEASFRLVRLQWLARLELQEHGSVSARTHSKVLEAKAALSAALVTHDAKGVRPCIGRRQSHRERCMSAIPTRPGLLARLWRHLHDKAEIYAMQCRRVTLADLDESLFLRIQELRAVQFQGSAEAAAEAAREIKRLGDRRDEVHAEDLRLRLRLALLGE